MTMELVNISADLALALILVSMWIVLSIEWPLWSSVTLASEALRQLCAHALLLSLCCDIFVVILSLQ